MHEHHVSTLLLFFLYGWLSKITCQFAPPPFGFDNFLFGGLGAFPPPPPPPPPIGSPPIGLENLFGQGQFAPVMPMGGMGGPYPMGPLPFPLFPMPCDVMCDHAPLFFANIAITNPQQARPGGAAGVPGGGAIPGGGSIPGGLPGGGGAGIMTTMRPGTGGAPGGVPGAGAGATGARPGAGTPGAGVPGAGVPGAGGAGATPTRPPGGAGMPTTMPTRPPTPGGGGAPGMMAPQNPNVNVQIMSFLPNYPNWCTGWCRFFYRPRPMMPPPPPPPPPPLPFPHPACLLFSWLGL